MIVDNPWFLMYRRTLCYALLTNELNEGPANKSLFKRLQRKWEPKSIMYDWWFIRELLHNNLAPREPSSQVSDHTYIAQHTDFGVYLYCTSVSVYIIYLV